MMHQPLSYNIYNKLIEDFLNYIQFKTLGRLFTFLTLIVPLLSMAETWQNQAVKPWIDNLFN